MTTLVTTADVETTRSEPLRLDHNERLIPDPELARVMADIPARALTRYPSAAGLEAALAERWNVAPERVLATAGGDDGIDRICRRYLRERPEMLSVTPTFEMIPLCTELAGGRLVEIRTLDDPAPLEPLLGRLGDATGVVSIISPHNPTGMAVSRERWIEISEALPRGAVLLADLAYIEFADEDPTPDLLRRDNVLILRTLSKAWGLAGLRVGFVLGSPAAVRGLRAAGPPFPLSGPSIWLARRALELGDRVTAGYVDAVRREREALTRLLAELGAEPFASQANFVLARIARPSVVHDRLLARGIRVRRFTDPADAIRITLPGEAAAFARLRAALPAAFRDDAFEEEEDEG